jgi:quinol monooxygenase YgiN
MARGDDKVLFVSLRINVQPSVVRHIIDLFTMYRGPVSVLSGCKSVNLYSHSTNPNEFIFIEEWSSEQSFEHHVRSDEFRKVLAMMDLSDSAPELKIRGIQWEKRFEMVEKLRRSES